MPHFDEFGGDEWICQVCGHVQNSKVKSVWRPDITGHKSAGNVCPKCLKDHEARGNMPKDGEVKHEGKKMFIWKEKYQEWIPCVFNDLGLSDDEAAAYGDSQIKKEE